MGLVLYEDGPVTLTVGELIVAIILNLCMIALGVVSVIFHAGILLLFIAPMELWFAGMLISDCLDTWYYPKKYKETH